MSQCLAKLYKRIEQYTQNGKSFKKPMNLNIYESDLIKILVKATAEE